jgi:TolA-binding protein
LVLSAEKNKTNKRGSFHGKKRNLKGVQTMTKEQLTAMGLTEEQATKVLEGLKTHLDGNYVTKTRFNEVNTELKQAKDSLTERDGQLETLKKSTGDIEAMKKQIVELQADNKTKDETHQAQIKQLKFDAALNSALVVSKAKNPETVKPLLKAFLEKAELDGEAIKGLDGELKKLVEGEDTKFLFNVAQSSNTGVTHRGMSPGQSNDGGGNTNTTMTLGEAIRAGIEGQFPK